MSGPSDQKWREAMDESSVSFNKAVAALEKAIKDQAHVHFCESEYEFARGDRRAGKAAHDKAMFVARTSAHSVVRDALSSGLGRKLFGLN